MPVPPEYTDARNALIAFRTKVLTDLVGGRVVAGLDANHQSMLKYKGIVDGLTITPYLFGRIKEYALALKFKNMDVGTGELRHVKGEYTGKLAEYPLQEPFNVPQRKLPQVDYFVFDVIKDLDLLRRTNVASIKSFIIIQVPSGTFDDTPDAENAIYDYYNMYPNMKYRGRYEVVDIVPGTYVYDYFRGERIDFRRKLQKKGTYDNYEYWLDLFMDISTYRIGVECESYGLMVWWGQPDDAPDITLNVCGQGMPTKFTINGVGYGTGVWLQDFRQNSVFGYFRFCRTLIESEAIATWNNVWDIHVTVNDKTMGTTEPIPPDETAEVQALSSLTLKGLPNAGYKVKHWKRDGLIVTTSPNYELWVNKDYEMECVFEKF